VNFSAAWRLIRTCNPLLRLAPAGRAVFVTESRAREPRAYWGAMGATKAGMEHLVLTWAQEVATRKVRVNLFDPGVVATRMRSNAFPGRIGRRCRDLTRWHRRWRCCACRRRSGMGRWWGWSRWCFGV
jgi:NAD(P)-dependent dehydrogenase (short-subunit alcohol dehydrogenase family)